MKDKKSCFIIMPLTTPEAFVSQFKGDNKHFLHVLENIFIPAIEKAGFNPIKPIAKGADLIQAEIIKNLNEVDLVLCDMSILNPNVFFEYGIRTALNKPVCVVKDHLTQNVPFDTTIINYHNYSAELNAWEIIEEIEKLSKHIYESYERNPTDNNLWKYFGLTTKVKFDISKGDEKDKLDLMLIEMSSIKDSLVNLSKQGKSVTLESLSQIKESSPSLEYIMVKPLINNVFSNNGEKHTLMAEGREGIILAVDTLRTKTLRELNLVAKATDKRIAVVFHTGKTIYLPVENEFLKNYDPRNKN